MVARFLRLRLALLGNASRRPAQLLALVIALGLAVAAIVGVASLRATTPDIARAVVVVLGSVVVLGFALLPLVFGADDRMDPRRFALFGIRPTPLALGLAAAGAVGMPAVLAAALAIAQVVTWSRGPVPVLLAILAAIILVPTCVLAARISAVLASSFLAGRRVRAATGLALTGVLAVLAPGIAVLLGVDWESRMLPVLRRIAAVVSWTPLGAAWSVPADAATGRESAPLKLLIALAFLVALALAWRLLVGMVLVRRERVGVARRYLGLGWFERLPASPGWAIAARSLSYWVRDARYRVARAAIPVAPVLMVVALLVAGVPGSIVQWVPVPMVCLFLGWLAHNDLAHDSSAFWIHVSASIGGRADRWGRLAPVFVVGVPVVILGSVVTVAVTGDWVVLPGMVGLSACLLLFGMGVSSLVSAMMPYPATHPEDNPFSQPMDADTSTVPGLALVAPVVAALPTIALVVLGALVDPVWYFAALAAGLAIGVGGLVIGVRAGGAFVSKHAPELLAFTLQN